MADLERTYTIPLRKQIIKVVRYQRSKKAVTGVIEFMMRHMKQPDKKKIKVGQALNLHIWKHGIKNPPPRVKVTAVKNSEGIVTVELFGAPKTSAKKTNSKKALEAELDAKLKEKITPATGDEKVIDTTAEEVAEEKPKHTAHKAAEHTEKKKPAHKKKEE